jgi:hypothetical protein
MARLSFLILAAGYGLVMSCGGTTPGGGIMPNPEIDALCYTDYNVTGTLTAPADVDPALGCQPDGTWLVNSFTVMSCGSDSDCQMAPCTNGKCSSCTSDPIASSYSITVTGDGAHGGSGSGEDLTNNNPSAPLCQGSNTSGCETDMFEINGDNGMCNAAFQMSIPNGSDWNVIVLSPSTPVWCPDPTVGSGSGSDDNITCGTGALSGTTIPLQGYASYALWPQGYISGGM